MWSGEVTVTVTVTVAVIWGTEKRRGGACCRYHMTPAAAVAIGLSAVLGLLVSLSTFLVIGATSSLSYNVIGHIKACLSNAGLSCRMIGF